MDDIVEGGMLTMPKRYPHCLTVFGVLRCHLWPSDKWTDKLFVGVLDQIMMM